MLAPMPKTKTLSDGNVMPTLGLGTWKSRPGEVKAAVHAALRAGYRHIDCAWIYGNEAEVGDGLRAAFDEGLVTRDEVWITSKLWNDAHRPEHVEEACRDSLTKLGLERLDLYLVHWPVAHTRGTMMPETRGDFVTLDEVPLAETWGAMERLVDAGLARSVGVSNLDAKRLAALSEGARIRPTVNQVELHPYLQQPALLEAATALDVALTAYSPLGSRDRAASMKADDEPVLLEDATLAAIAEAHGATPAQVCIAWAIQRGTIVIPKSVNEGRIRQNLEATQLTLSADEMARVAQLDRHRRYVDGTFWTDGESPYSLAELWGE